MKSVPVSLIGCFLLLLRFPLSAQENFYRTDAVREIRIQFSQANWKHLLDSLFLATGDEGRLMGDVVIDGTLLKKVGVRYKGYSSWNSDEVKNPFNIDLDYCLEDQNYQGFTKLKLSNVIHDPSFVREVLSYEIARDYLPAPRANFANLYINDTLIGLYTNVEAVNKTFTENCYGSRDHSFFKGEPEKLEYPFGQNANLAYTHGTDSSGYLPYYKLESDYGWNDLLSLIYTLNLDTLNLESILNIDRTLWMHAFNYVLLNLDSYIAYAQNYYLYWDDNGRFNPILWDLNMSFGSFRESDGSTHFQGLTIDQMKTLDPLEHLYFSISPRPLMTILFRNDQYRKIYLAHMRTIITEHFSDTGYIERARSLQNMIDAYVLQDTNKFYSYEDFRQNLTQTVGGTGSMIEYPGIADLMQARVAYLLAYPGIGNEPEISAVQSTPEHPVLLDTAWIKAVVSNASQVILASRNSGTGPFMTTQMFDDGNHHDAVAGDGWFGAGIPVTGVILQYYMVAENDSAIAFYPPRAENEVYTIYPAVLPGELVMNEIMVSGNELNPDPNGDYDSWIELCNTTGEALSLGGVSLSDPNVNAIRWFFPDTLLPPKSYLIVWADGDTTQDGLHANFTLSETGGELSLFGYDGSTIDHVVFGNQVPGKSIGRYPNGTGSLSFMTPSFSAYNFIGTTPASGFLLYPNPTTDEITLEMKQKAVLPSISIYNLLGQQLYENRNFPSVEKGDGMILHLDVSGLRQGIYYITVTDTGNTYSGKFIKN